MNVDVVLPVYDGVRFVEEAIDSVLAQTHERFELVVVDGGSTDGTIAAVRGYDDPRLTLLETDAGLGASKNRGIRATSGELVAFIDHDDVWHPEKLERHVRAHRETGADLVYSDAVIERADGTVVREAARPDPASPGEPLVRQLLLDEELVILTHSSVTVRRSAWAAIDGFDPAFDIAEDADFHVRLAGNHRFERLPEPLVRKRDHDRNLSDDYRQSYRAHDRLIEKAMDRYAFLDERDERRRRSRNAYLRATSALGTGHSREAIQYALESLRFERRVRPVLVALLGLTDLLTGPLAAGTRLFGVYERRIFD